MAPVDLAEHLFNVLVSDSGAYAEASSVLLDTSLVYSICIPRIRNPSYGPTPVGDTLEPHLPQTRHMPDAGQNSQLGTALSTLSGPKGYFSDRS